MDRPPFETPCPECRGKGSIALLISTVPCAKCSGRGTLHPVLDRDLLEFDLSIRTRTIFRKMGVRTLRDLSRLSEGELRANKNVIELTVTEVRRLLATHGLRFAAPAPT